jgi:predicted lipoprotein with Yx(FWY)xxD motif
MFKIAGLSLGLTMLATVAFATEEYETVIKEAVVGGETILTNADGMTLYTYDNDKPGVSNCNGGCAKKWPPLEATTEGLQEGDYSVITRKDGRLQWAYYGKPLYTWIKDKEPGQTSGDGLGGKWHVAKPDD